MPPWSAGKKKTKAKNDDILELRGMIILTSLKNSNETVHSKTPQCELCSYT